MMYTIFNTTTGEILRVINTNQIESQIKDNESFIDGEFLDDEYYIEYNQPVLITPKPNDYSVFNFETKQWVTVESKAIADVSSKRNKLLYQTDWTQIPNGPLTVQQQNSWAIYRQQLRDISTQSGYPYNVVWPTPPN